MRNAEGGTPNPRPPVRSAGGVGHSALILWLALQLAALATASLPLTLSRVDVRPLERIAPHLLLVMQLSAAGLLFPVLLGNWRMAAVVAASALPMMQLAAMLGGERPAGLWWTAGLLIADLLILTVLGAWLRTPAARMRAVSLLAGWVLLGGLALMARLNLQFADNSIVLSPLDILLRQLDSARLTAASGWNLAVVGGLGLAYIFRAIRGRYQGR